ncbi:MAG: hypothetical protein CME64_05615 [Halobacteriovoraceae bacterium]|nr:hypothetical protein [Halobacteriovoraceae bacterium]|tara:strand:+ start:220004 stop:220489 length:486 start_codon:yes stop_codon:yes gene_type:complete
MKYFFVMLFSWSLLATAQFHPGHCRVKPNLECEQEIKSRIPKYQYSSDEHNRQIKYHCAGNPGGACVKKLAKTLPWYNTNNRDDLNKVALSCALTDMDCLNFVAKKVGKRNLRSLEDTREVAMACDRSDIVCLETACKDEFNCDRKEQLLDAARSCYQPCY